MTRAARVLVGVCGLVLYGCGSSPEPVYYALGSTGGAAQPGWARLVELRHLGLPGYLDRADIVSGVSDHRVRIESGRRWAEPLGDMMGRVLAQDLSQRLPGSTVFTESSVSLDPDATVEVDVQSLDIDDQGRLTMTAEVVVARGRERGAAAVRSLGLPSNRRGSGVAGLADALSALVGDLADGIAAMLRATPPGVPGP